MHAVECKGRFRTLSSIVSVVFPAIIVVHLVVEIHVLDYLMARHRGGAELPARRTLER